MLKVMGFIVSQDKEEFITMDLFTCLLVEPYA